MKEARNEDLVERTNKHEAMGKENMRKCKRKKKIFLGQSENKDPVCTYFPLAFDWLTR